MDPKSGIIIAIIFYLVVGYINEFVAENQVYHDINQPPLFDRLHNLIPPISAKYANGLLVLLLLYFIFRWGIKSYSVLENYLWIVALLFVGRVIIFSLTQVPPAVTGCSTKKPHSPFHYILMYDWKECLDYMYSGHAIHSVLIVLFVLMLSKSMFEKIGIGLLVLLELYFIVAARIHYSSDILVGTLMTILIFYAWPGVDKLLDNISSGGLYGKLLNSKSYLN
jgi:hypothetical protein